MFATKAAMACTFFVGLVTAAHAEEFTYTCDNGAKLTVAFENTSQGQLALINSGSGNLSLPQAPSADGARYAEGDVEFWTKGSGATFTRGGVKITCKH